MWLLDTNVWVHFLNPGQSLVKTRSSNTNPIRFGSVMSLKLNCIMALTKAVASKKIWRC